MAEDLTHGFSDPLGAEALAYFERVAWLRDHDVLTARFRVEESTALERVFLPGDEGWNQVVARLHRGTARRGSTRSTISWPRSSRACAVTA